MNAAAGFAAMSRATVLGNTKRSRFFALAVVVLVLVVATVAGMAGLGPFTDFLFFEAIVLTALVASAGSTSTALRAQRVFGVARAPSGALRGWRLGWAEGQAWTAGVLAALLVADAAWRRAAEPLWLLPGAVVAVQAVAAWGAFAFVGRSIRLRWMALAVAGLIVAAHEVGPALLVALTPPFAGLLLLGLGAGGLVALGRQLGPAARWQAPVSSQSAWLAAIARGLRRWTPLSASMGSRWWSLWVSAASNILLVASQNGGGLWSSPAPTIRATLLLWFTCMVTSTLVGRTLHWRVLLRPGGPRRGRLGRHFFFSTLQVYLMLLAPSLVVVIAIATWTGLAPDEIVDHLRHAAHFAFELPFTIALAVWLVGLLSDRFSQRVIAWVVGAPAAGAMVLVMVSRSWMGPFEVEPPSGTAVYLGGLVVLTVIFVGLADRAWARRDLADLARRRFGREGS